jgi:hypothetical protein
MGARGGRRWSQEPRPPREERIHHDRVLPTSHLILQIRREEQICAVLAEEARVAMWWAVA